MSTAAQYLNDGTVAANRIASGFQGIDPRRRRFALNPGIYLAMMEPRESGQQEILLRNGLVTFRTASIRQDDFESALKNGHNPSAKLASVVHEVTAFEFLRNALIRYQDQGMRELPSLTMLNDPEPNEKGKVTAEAFRQSAQGYFQALWPSFPEIGHECPAGLQECATCRLWLLGNPEEPGGMAVHEDLIERAAKLPNQEIATSLRIELRAALLAREAWLKHKWAELVGELADRKNGAPAIAKLGEAEHHVRRNLHEIEPSESATAASFGSEVASGQREGFKELAQAMRESRGGDNTEILKLMIERQNQTDEVLKSLAESVKVLVEKKTE